MLSASLNKTFLSFLHSVIILEKVLQFKNVCILHELFFFLLRVKCVSTTYKVSGWIETVHTVAVIMQISNSSPG